MKISSVLAPRSERLMSFGIPSIAGDTGTIILSTRCDLPTIKKQEITFVETSDGLIKGFRLNTTDLATLRYGQFNDTEIQNETVVVFLEFQLQLLVKWQSLTLVYFYRNRTVCFVQKDYWQGRQTIFGKQWTEEVMFVQVQISDRKATSFQIQGKKYDCCYWYSVACNELVCHKFPKSGLETGLFCCINSQGFCQIKESIEMPLVGENSLMPGKPSRVSLIPFKNANAEKLNEKFLPIFLAGALKYLSAPVCKKRSLQSVIHMKKCHGLQYTFVENNLPFNECHIPREGKKSLEYTLEITIWSPKKGPKQRKNHDLKGRNDEVKGQKKKQIGYGKYRKEKKREMNTPHASSSLSKPSKLFENHTTETYSVINKDDTPRKTYSDLPLLYNFFKGGKINAVVWQTVLCCAFVFMMLFSSATGVPYNEYRGIQESARNMSRCPTTKENMVKRAEIKKCQDFSNSFGKQLEYHCVLNDRGTGFVEVCSPVTKIIGEFCAEYNDGLGGIQPQKQKSCMGTCPFVYNSTDLYKYWSVCYKGLRQSEDKDSDMKDPETSTTYVNNITEGEKDFSPSIINKTRHLQENGTIPKNPQLLQYSRCEGCSYIAIFYTAIAIAVLVSVLLVILHFKHKNSRQASQEVLVSVTSCTVGVHVPVDNNGAVKTMIVETSGCCNGTEV